MNNPEQYIAKVFAPWFFGRLRTHLFVILFCWYLKPQYPISANSLYTTLRLNDILHSTKHCFGQFYKYNKSEHIPSLLRSIKDYPRRIVVSHVLKIRHKLDSEQDWYTAMSAESRLISEKHNYNETWLNSEPVWCNWKIEINIRPGRGLIRSSSTLLETAARNVWFRGRPPIKSSAGVMQYLHNFGESMWWPPYRHRLGRPNSLITHTTEYS